MKVSVSGEARNAEQPKVTASSQDGVESNRRRTLSPQRRCQPEVNSIRPATPASLLAKGEACGGQTLSVGLSHSHPASKDEGRGVEGDWRWNEMKGSWLTMEIRMGGRQGPPCGSQSVHSSAEAINTRGAKGRRKVNA